MDQVRGRLSRRELVLASAASLVPACGFAQPANSPARTQAARVSVAQIARRGRSLDQVLTTLAAQDFVSGSVLIAKGGKPLFEKAYGWASREYRRKATVDTKFKVGSINKIMTATAIMRLSETGHVDLEMPVGRYLSAEWLSPDIAGRVKVGHLLAHTSGLGDYFPLMEPMSREKLRTIGDYRPLVAQSLLTFAPGTRWSYSNTGYLLLGGIIEAVTNAPYIEAFEKLLFQPAGMEATAPIDITSVPQGVAQGYGKEPVAPAPAPALTTAPPGSVDFAVRAEQNYASQKALHRSGFRLRNNVLAHTRTGTPAGGMFSTVGDLHRFLHALFEGRLVRLDTLRLMLPPKPWAPRWGLGIETIANGFGHTGGFDGIEGVAAYFPGDGYLVILSNIDRGASAAFSEMMRLTAS